MNTKSILNYSVNNKSITEEEEYGAAKSLIPTNRTYLSQETRNHIARLSILEVIY